MKITLQPSDSEALEVIIRGNLSDPQIPQIIAALHAAKATSCLFLYQKDKEYLCPVKDISYFEAMDGKIIAFTKQGCMEARNKLYELAQTLYHSGFVQINKGTLLNVRQAQSVQSEFSGNYIVTLQDGKTHLTISRKYFKAFRTYVEKEL